MEHYRYLIIGGGMTGSAAVKGIRQIDSSGTIGVIGAEAHRPYNRPPLTKGLWQGKAVASIWRNGGDARVDYILQRKVLSIDPTARTALDDWGRTYRYDRLLLATGGTPRRLPFGAQEGVLYYRTLDDYYRLRQAARPGARVAVIGGGFIGSEISASLALNGLQVTLIFPEAGIGARLFPPDLSRFLNSYYEERGVEVRAGEIVRGLDRQDGGYRLLTDRGRVIQADLVVAGLGIQPNVELGQAAGLQVENGLVVDEMLRTSQPEIFAAGDVASFYNPALGKRMRVEHADNANTMGEAAGRNMAGAEQPYHHLPFFYSDLFDLGYEAVGDLDPRLEVVADWQEPYRKGVLYYLEGSRVRGVLLWNVWDQVEDARQLIAEAGSLSIPAFSRQLLVE